MTSPPSFQLGWSLVLAAFITGAGLGLFFHREDFLGGYTSLSRRMLRLGHIALAALGLLNVIFAMTPVDLISERFVSAAAICLGAGAVLMPLVCFLTAWRTPFRRLFFLPVSLLMAGVTFIVLGVRS